MSERRINRSDRPSLEREARGLASSLRKMNRITHRHLTALDAINQADPLQGLPDEQAIRCLAWISTTLRWMIDRRVEDATTWQGDDDIGTLFAQLQQLSPERAEAVKRAMYEAKLDA